MEKLNTLIKENNYLEALYESSKLDLSIITNIIKTKISSEDLNTYNNIVRLKMLGDWTSSKNLCNMWNKMSKGNYTWNNLRMVYEGPYDYIILINRTPDELSENDIKKTILFRMEPLSNPFCVWNNIPDISNFFKVYYHENGDYNNIEWHLSKTWTELTNNTCCLEKDNSLSDCLSTVLSPKYFWPGHILRIDFVKFLENKDINIHVFGDNKFNYKNYKGSLPEYCKDNALIPYKYTFNAENHSDNNYFTEKITDAILSECLIFYWGCPNICDYIDELAYVRLDLNNFEESYNIIKKAIEEDWWAQRIDIIRKEKLKILNDLSMFPRIEKLLLERTNK